MQLEPRQLQFFELHLCEQIQLALEVRVFAVEFYQHLQEFVCVCMDK